MHLESQGVGRNHALFSFWTYFLFFCKITPQVQLFGQNFIFLTFRRFLTRRQKSSVLKGLLQPKFCRLGKIIMCVLSSNLSFTQLCICFRGKITSFAEHSGNSFVLRKYEDFSNMSIFPHFHSTFTKY